MKTVEKIILIIYSNIMLIVSIIACLVLFGWLKIDIVYNLIDRWIANEIIKNVLIGISAIFIIFSTKCIFFDSTSKEREKERRGVLLENENGKLMISKETIENLVTNVARSFQSAKDITTRVELDKENNVVIFATLIVATDVIIKELSADFQNKVKEKIKIATDLEVKEVNITIKKVVEESKKIENV